MEVKSVRVFHPFRDLSLKWSFVLYATACVIAILVISTLIYGHS